MVQFLSMSFLSLISSIFVGFFQKFPFFVSPVFVPLQAIMYYQAPRLTGRLDSC